MEGKGSLPDSAYAVVAQGRPRGAGKPMLVALAWSQHGAGAGAPILEGTEAELLPLRSSGSALSSLQKAHEQYWSSIMLTICWSGAIAERRWLLRSGCSG